MSLTRPRLGRFTLLSQWTKVAYDKADVTTDLETIEFSSSDLDRQTQATAGIFSSRNVGEGVRLRLTFISLQIIPTTFLLLFSFVKLYS